MIDVMSGIGKTAYRRGTAVYARRKTVTALSVAALLLIMLIPAPAGADTCSRGWTAFGGDLGNTGVAASSIDTPLSQRWSFEGEGMILSTPVVTGGRLIFGDGGGTVYCLEPLTGDVIWTADAGDAVESSPVFIAPGGGAPDGKVVLGTNSGKVLCLDAGNGSALWNVTTGGYVKSSPCFVPDPSGYSGRIYVGSYDGAVYCLDSDDGSELWRFPGCDRIHPGPAYADGLIIFGACDGQLYALDANDGTREWNYTADYFPGSASVSGGLVFAGSASGLFHCVDLADGSLNWQYDLGGSVFSTPAVEGGRVYAGSDNETLVALDPSDGSLIWSVETDGLIKAPPVLAGGALVIGTGGGELLVLAADTGAERYNATLEGGVEAGAAVTGGMAFVGTTDGIMYAFADGTVRPPEEEPVVVLNATADPAVLEVSGGAGDLKDVCSVEIRLDGGDWTTLTGPHDWRDRNVWSAVIELTLDPEGEENHTVEYRVVTPLGVFPGGEGAVSPPDDPPEPPPDETPPAVNITRPADREEVSGTVVIQGTAADETNLTGVWVKVDDGSWEPAQGGGEWSYVWDTGGLAAGEHLVQVRAEDGVNENITSAVFIVEESGEKDGEPGDIMEAVIVWVILLLVLGLVIGYAVARAKAPRQDDEGEVTEPGKKEEKS